MSFIRPSGYDDQPWLLDFSELRFCEVYVTAEEALAFAAWWDQEVGGGSDLGDEIREAVS